MGSIGAWRKLAPPDDATPDGTVYQYRDAWRAAHPETLKFWHAADRAAVQAVLNPGATFTRKRISFTRDGDFLRMRLPSGRDLAYPFPRTKIVKDKDGDDKHVVIFMDNEKGKWVPFRQGRGAYGATWIENAVQAISRDLFAEAMQRLEAAGYRIVLHVHDEIVAEVPDGSGSPEEFRRIMIELPAWAEGLPVDAEVRSGLRFCKDKKPDAKAATAPVPVPAVTVLPQPVVVAPLTPERGITPGKVCCPFHTDNTPSCEVYADGHFHCFGCGAHGDAVDWLMMVEDMTRAEAVAHLKTGANTAAAPTAQPVPPKRDTTRAAMALWAAAKPIAGTLAARYLEETRKIDLAALPVSVDDVLRFHPNCPFNGTSHPCLLALMRDVATDEPTGIHRIALTRDAQKIERMSLGRVGVVKLWPAVNGHLVVGEGIETVLAAATRMSHQGAPLQPAWSAVSSGRLGAFPILPGIERLIVLVDNDLNGVGQRDAGHCTERWRRAGRTVERLMPKRAGADFNDLIME
jgi:CHC2 zinc finger/Toprim domain